MKFDTYQQRVKFARKRLGLSQNDVAAAIGVTQSSYGQLERGQSSATKYTAELADLFQVNALWLATGKGYWSDISSYADSLDPSDETGRQLLQAFQEIVEYAPEEKKRILRMLRAYLEQ